MIYRAFKSTSTHDFFVSFELFGLIGRYFLCLLELVPRRFICLCDHPLAIRCVHGTGRQLRDINFAILIHGLWLLNDFEEGAGNTSGAPELRAAIIVWIGVCRTRLNPVTLLSTAVANVTGRRRLVWDCRLLGEEWAVVDTLAILLSACCCTKSDKRFDLRSDVSRVSRPGRLVLVEHGL
jgi:hypothetical protein